MTLGITPANYSLGTLWYEGRLSCPSQVNYISSNPLIARVEMFKHSLLPHFKCIYISLHFRTKVFPQETILIVAQAFVHNVWVIFLHCVLAKEMRLRVVVVEKLSILKLIPAPFAKVSQSIASLSL